MSLDVGMNWGSVYGNGDNRGEIEVFFSRGGHVTDYHFDFMDNYTFQLKGKKKWSLLQSTVRSPIRGATPHYKNIDTFEQQLKIHRLQDPSFEVFNEEGFFDEAETVELVPGSVLYFPAGMWHRVECTEDSVSVNISLMPSTYGDALISSLSHSLLSDERFREGVRVNDFEQARLIMKDRLAELKKIVSSLSVDDIMPRARMYPRPETLRFDGEGKLVVDASSLPESFKALVSKDKMEVDSSSVEETYCVSRLSTFLQHSSTLRPEERDEKKATEKEGNDNGEKEGDEEEEDDEDDFGMDDGEEKRKNEVAFFCHHSISGEELESATRMAVYVPKGSSIEAAMSQWCSRKEVASSDASVVRVGRVLASLGFLQRQ